MAIIADIVQSRNIHGSERRSLQRRLNEVLRQINTRHAKAILSKFVITTGDEFQGLLANATAIPDIVWTLEQELPTVEIRIGVGCGGLDTPLAEYAVGMDGPVWHRARSAVVEAESSRRLGGVFEGFGDPDQAILNGLARLMRHLREQLTRKQREILHALRENPLQTALAENRGISKQAVSKQAKSAGWDAFREGEAAWGAALDGFNFSSLWPKRRR